MNPFRCGSGAGAGPGASGLSFAPDPPPAGLPCESVSCAYLGCEVFRSECV